MYKAVEEKQMKFFEAEESRRKAYADEEEKARKETKKNAVHVFVFFFATGDYWTTCSVFTVIWPILLHATLFASLWYILCI